jgi:hypothetical protein
MYTSHARRALSRQHRAPETNLDLINQQLNNFLYNWQFVHRSEALLHSTSMLDTHALPAIFISIAWLQRDSC